MIQFHIFRFLNFGQCCSEFFGLSVSFKELKLISFQIVCINAISFSSQHFHHLRIEHSDVHQRSQNIFVKQTHFKGIVPLCPKLLSTKYTIQIILRMHNEDTLGFEQLMVDQAELSSHDLSPTHGSVQMETLWFVSIFVTHKSHQELGSFLHTEQ